MSSVEDPRYLWTLGARRDCAGDHHHVTQRINARTSDIGFKKHLAKPGAGIVASSPEQFAAFLKRETAKMAKRVKDAGI